MPYSFVFTGGGTGGHVFPALAVARVLRERGHRVLFIGTPAGIEARLVPEAGFPIEFVRSGALNRVGLWRQLRSAAQLPLNVAAAWNVLGRVRPQAIFSMGGYAAGPVMLAALLGRIPLVVMEPNAVPGFANRKVAKRVYRALLGFEAARAWFPKERSEVTGLPVRAEFFAVRPKQDGVFTLLITGGSGGARTLNNAARSSWTYFRGKPVRIISQVGSRATAELEQLIREFSKAGLEGEVVPFIANMAEAFAGADLVVSRAGAGAVNEIAAAGMAAILVPLPFAADDHQRRNAETLAEAGAARLVADQEMNGERLFEEVEKLREGPDELASMRERVRAFSHPGAAERAADVMEEAAGKRAL